MEKQKLDPRLLLPLLIIPLLIVMKLRKKRKARKERAAAKALAKRLAEQRKSGKGKTEKGGKQGKKSKGFIANRGSAYRKRLFRFLLMLGLERLIAARRAQMEESLPSNSLVKRFSKAKDI